MLGEKAEIDVLCVVPRGQRCISRVAVVRAADVSGSEGVVGQEVFVGGRELVGVNVMQCVAVCCSVLKCFIAASCRFIVLVDVLCCIVS